DLVLNRATDNIVATAPPLPAKLNWSTATFTGLDISAAKSALNTTSLGPLTSNVDLNANGSVALDALGFVVGKADFTITLATANVTTGNPALGTLNNANLLTASLTNVQLFAGVGATLLDNNGGTPTPNVYSDDTLRTTGATGFSIPAG